MKKETLGKGKRLFQEICDQVEIISILKSDSDVHIGGRNQGETRKVIIWYKTRKELLSFFEEKLKKVREEFEGL